jgi:heavy metal sensor kinase
MFLNSIRWRLQLWYGLILVAVLAGFGFTAYQLERNEKVRSMDGELHRRLTGLSNWRHGPPRGPRPPDQIPFDRLPADQGRPADDQQPPPGPDQFRPPRQGPPFRPGRPMDAGEADGAGDQPQELHLPPGLAELFNEDDPTGFYYLLVGQEGKELLRSSNAPAGASKHLPGFAGPAPGRPLNGPPRLGSMQPPVVRERDTYREMILPGRPGERIVVGHSLVSESADLRRFALMLAGVGGAILLLGLAGGWWLATRAIRPIEDISETALKISAVDLSRRINVSDTESELGRLVDVLNSTFARLEASFAQQQQFTSDAAHELRTPVSVMLAQTQTALSRARGPAEYRETVQTCERAAQRMRRLIESLLELARLDAGQETMQRAPLDLARVAAESVEQVRPLAAARGITIHLEGSAAECTGDAERLAQVITNLVTNAVHYNKTGGEIRVTTAREKDSVLLTVADTGLGIAPEHLPHIFERFYRADPARTSSQGRTGLGLAISKAIVEAHSGRIDVTSETNVGTKFTVRLPA